MRKQPRDTNNPANPLYKAASLDIRRANERIGKHRSCDVNVTLNFKKSNDMRGQTQDTNGKEITVNFTLANRRATFEMNVIFEQVNDLAYLSISKVAFVDSMTTDRSVKVANAGDTRRQTGSSAEGCASVSLGRAKVDAKGRVAAAKKQSSASSRADTYERNTINWSLDSLWARQELNEEQTYLSGEVFRNPAANKQIRACRMRWDVHKASSTPEIHGSVRVMTQDLLISDINFLDEDGKKLSWNAIRKPTSDGTVPSLKEKLFPDQEKMRDRLVRQIVRKHLVSQGMTLEGASLEICSARG
jgi:hypothetical protein